MLGYHVSIDEAQSRGLSIFEYAPKDRGALALAAVARSSSPLARALRGAFRMSRIEDPRLRLDGIEPLEICPRSSTCARARPLRGRRDRRSAARSALVPPDAAPAATSRRGSAGPAPSRGRIDRWMGEDVLRARGARGAGGEGRALVRGAPARDAPLPRALPQLVPRAEQGHEHIPAAARRCSLRTTRATALDGSMVDARRAAAKRSAAAPGAIFDRFVSKLGPVAPLLRGRRRRDGEPREPHCAPAAGSARAGVPGRSRSIVKPVTQSYGCSTSTPASCARR